jgi:ribonuclease HI
MEIYTDGGCSGNPGPGGWAYVIKRPSHPEGHLEGSGSEKFTTNNKMELTAVIQALERYKQIRTADGQAEAAPGDGLAIVTDSQYVKNGITSWIHGWKKNGWKTASKEPVKNRELWERLDLLNAEIKPEWRWVKGHAGNELNERCDTLVNIRMREIT